ncbi:MAG: hypothetical protein ACI9F9_000247 [Candidatus Paceibacteria bacterium]|jgi:hypothetical protein
MAGAAKRGRTMKRLFLFAILFGGGLYLLLQLSERHREEKKDRVENEQEVIMDKEGATELPFTRIPARPAAAETTEAADHAAADEGIAGTVRGEIKLAVREKTEPRNILYRVHIDDVEPSGDDYYNFKGLTVKEFDPANEELRTTFKAREGVLRIERDGSTLTIGEKERIQLVDAVVTLHTGSPMAPIELRLPRAELDLGDGSLYSKSAVQVLGEGITGAGTGLELLERGKRLRLLEDGVMTLTSDEETNLELRAAAGGTIALRRLASRDGKERVEIRLADGGELTAKGDQAMHIRADDLALEGRVIQIEKKTPTETKRRRVFRAEHAMLSGNVSIRRDGHHTESGVAEVFFDALGELRRLWLEEEPVAYGHLNVEATETKPAEAVPIEMRGVGPLDLTYTSASPAAEFVLSGPSEVTSRELDLLLKAEEGIRGRFWGRGLADATLQGPVTGNFEAISFDGSNLSIRGRESSASDQSLYFETENPSHVAGLDKEGALVDMRTSGTLKFVLEKKLMAIVLARNVNVSWAGQESWTAAMGEVQQFDFESGSFQASKGVEYQGPLGNGFATSAIGHSREHLELFGKEGLPATYNLTPSPDSAHKVGLLKARHLDLSKNRARAEGKVEMRYAGEELRQEIDCASFVLLPLAERQLGSPVPFEFEATEVSRALLVGKDTESNLIAQSITGRGTFTETKDDPSLASFTIEALMAKGNVQFTYLGDAGDFKAKGGSVTWTSEGSGRLEAPAGSRVEARGRFEAAGLPYLLTATWIEYEKEELQALFPEITIDRPAALPLLLGVRKLTELHSGSANWMTSDKYGLLLAGDAHFSGKTPDGQKIELDAGSMHLSRNPDQAANTEGVDELVAWDGFKLELEGALTGTGEVFQAGYDLLRFEGRPAKMEVQGYVWEASNILYDVPRVLVTTDQGRFFAAEGSEAAGWEATYESLRPFEDEDSTMMVMRNLTLRNAGSEVRANWATFWLDREEWLDKTQRWMSGEEEAPAPAPAAPAREEAGAKAPTLFGRLDVSGLSRVLKELYLEGTVEYLKEGERVAQMEAAYVDLVDGHGWIQDCELFMDVRVGRVQTDLIVRADWLRHSADGSLSADSAQVTACGFAVPDYFIETKNLRMVPAGDGSSVWDILLKDNSLVFDSGLSIPLPRVHYKSDGKGRPTFSALGFGDSARYGTFVEASVDVDVGDSVSSMFSRALNATPEEIDGRYRLKASYYGSRGLLLDQRFRLTAADHFWMNIFLDGLYDSGEDRGLVRSKGPDGDTLRWILATQARYELSASEWFDFALADQSDAGAQAEFTESQFISYERRDNYLRWRKAKDQHYYSANLRYRLDSFRSDVERLPDLGYVRGATPVGELFGQPLLYTATADAAYLRLRQAEGTVVSPFDPVFNPSLGNREILRADTRHRVESPVNLGFGGLRMSPYVELIGTVWSEGVNPDEAPSRGAAIAGVEAQSSFYRAGRHGVVNTLTPFAGVHGDVASFEENGEPVQLDAVDDPITGRFLDLGLRSRWRVPGGARYLDLSVRGTHGTDVELGEEEGWQPLRVLGELLAVYEGTPFAFTHDGKYDLDDGDTTHSYTSFSILPVPDVGVEIGYNRGLDERRVKIFDAVSLGARWNATPKWQVEGRQSISKLDNQALSSDFLLRRLGHDFIFEVAYGFRSGEGGNTLSFKYRPLLGWREPSFGLMQALQRARL